MSKTVEFRPHIVDQGLGVVKVADLSLDSRLVPCGAAEGIHGQQLRTKAHQAFLDATVPS